MANPNEAEKLPPAFDEGAIAAATTSKVLKTGTGLVAMKREFIRERTARDASAAGVAADARLRGQNKGTAREHVKIEGSGTKPAFEGEVNFLHGETLAKVKVAHRAFAGMSDRSNDRQQQQQKPKQPEPSSEPTVQAEKDGAKDVEQEAAAPPPPPAGQPSEVEPAVVAASSPLPPKPDARPLERPAVTALPVRRSDEPKDVRQKRLFHDKLVLAPLTTVGNLPFRRICKNFGVDVTVGEMALANNLNHTQKSEWSLLRRHESEDIFGLQVACGRGNDAAKLGALLEASEFSYDFVDINCGCPVDLMCRKGIGFGLWERQNRLRDVVKNLVRYQGRPVTVKVRIGADETDPQLHKHIHNYEAWGAEAVTIHGRSKKQRYTKLANWSYIEECAKLTSLPVIGDGDVFTPENYVERRELAPSVVSTMVGRGALIKPWVFKEVKEGVVWDISSSERFDMLKDFGNYGLSHWGSDEKGVANTRRYMCEWLSFLYRYVPVGLLEQQPQFMNDRPPYYVGRNDLETLMSSDQVHDWIALTEMILGPAGDKFKFTPKHKSNSYQSVDGAAQVTAEVEG